MNRRLKHILRLPTVMLFACMLYGCIEIEDFGEYWDKGFVDNCVNAIVRRDMLEDEGDLGAEKDKQLQLRSLKIGNHLFLMIRNHPDNPGGSMVRYEVKDGQFITYRLNDHKRDAFLADYPDSPVILDDVTATIPLLNDQSVLLVQKIADDSSYWLENSRNDYNPNKLATCVKDNPAP